MDLVSLLVLVIIIGLVYWAVNALAGAFGIPAPIVTIINVVLVVVFVLYLLSVFFGARTGVALPPLHR